VQHELIAFERTRNLLQALMAGLHCGIQHQVETEVAVAASQPARVRGLVGVAQQSALVPEVSFAHEIH